MLNIRRSSYFAWLLRQPSRQELSNQELDKKIAEVFSLHQQRYGYPRITEELKAKGLICSKNRVARRMSLLKLKVRTKSKFKITTDSNHQLPVAPNRLNRDFKAKAPNEKYVGGITYIWTNEGWLYLATVIDLYSRAVIGWPIQPTMTRQLVCDALKMALQRRGFPQNVLYHSDRGSQYCSEDFQQLLKTHNFICSMSRKGNCWDNSVAESFFKTLKTELIYKANYAIRQKAKENIFHYIKVYYNRVRRHSSIGWVAPMIYEANYINVA